MYFFNLSGLQFLALLGSVSGLAVALYLLDRSHRRVVVSTLRFWAAARGPLSSAHRRRIQQPWSLVLQLISMALLLLAVAQLRLGTPAAAPRDHVLILDTSAWMGARSGNRTLMDLAKDRAIQYLHAIPTSDRVMLIRADSLTTPATAFEPDRQKVEAAIQGSQPGSTALNLDQALAFARHAQVGRRAGEIAYVGAGRVADESGAAVGPLRNLRVIPVADSVENSGLRRIGTRRSISDQDLWEIYVSAHNYGTLRRNPMLSLYFGPPNGGRVLVGSRRMALPPGGDGEASFELRTRSAGILAVMLTPHDGFPADDQATLELPAEPALTITVYSTQPELLRPMLAANARMLAVYRKPSEYRADDHGLVILDRFAPARRPSADSLWIAPPREGSPVPIRDSVQHVAFGHWDTEQPAASGLRATDFKFDNVSIFETAPGDNRIAEVEAGPIIVARPGKPKIVVLGFHPTLSPMRYELAAPLLFANLMRWFSPDIFRRWELNGGSVGAVKLTLDQQVNPSDVRILQEDGSPVPYMVHDRALNFFVSTPGTVRVLAADREYVYSLTLPQLWDAKWEPPADARRGIPRFQALSQASLDLWPWLALAGAVGLLAEWLLFGVARARRLVTGVRRMTLRRKPVSRSMEAAR
jgi:hypothetical protein